MAVDRGTEQLVMPGMPPPAVEAPRLGHLDVLPGQRVLYTGSLSGGPRSGARGIVKRAMGRRAVVDMGLLGTWRIPYLFLAIPQRA